MADRPSIASFEQNDAAPDNASDTVSAHLADNQKRSTRKLRVMSLNRALLQARYRSFGMRPTRCEVEQGSIHVWRGGKGPAILLIHGFGVGALETWQNQAPLFCRRFTVLCPDILYFGQTKARKGVIGGPSDQADAIAAACKKLGYERLTVMGISFGGFIALRMAKRYPELVRRMVLIDAAGLEPTETEREQVFSQFPGAEHIVDVLIPNCTDELRHFLQTVFYKPRYIPKFILKEILEDEFWLNREAKAGICESAQEELFSTEDLCSMEVPSHIVWGKYDPLMPLSMGVRLADNLPHAELYVFEKSAHVPVLEQPRRFNEEVLRRYKALGRGETWFR